MNYNNINDKLKMDAEEYTHFYKIYKEEYDKANELIKSTLKTISGCANIGEIYDSFLPKINEIENKEESKCLYCSPLCSLYGTGKCEGKND